MHVHARPGFTLIEVLVVVSIISILAMLTFTGIFNARKEARDNVRINTAEQLKLGIRLYKEAHGSYPDYADGVEIGVGGTIDAELAPFLPQISPDPLESAQPDVYGYWYFSDYHCNGLTRNAIVVETLEIQEGNYNEVCGVSLPLLDSIVPTASASFGQTAYAWIDDAPDFDHVYITFVE